MKLRYGIILTLLVLLLSASAFDVFETEALTTEEAATTTVIQTNGNEYNSMEEFQASTDFIKFTIDNLWILIAAFMVLMMHLGFASVKSGLTQSKNAVNVIYKNVFIVTVGI